MTNHVQKKKYISYLEIKLVVVNPCQFPLPTITGKTVNYGSTVYKKKSLWVNLINKKSIMGNRVQMGKYVGLPVINPLKNFTYFLN